MAQGIGNFIDRIQLGTDEANQIAIGSSAYAVCSTAAATAKKQITIKGFTLNTGTTIHVKFTNNNSADSPTLEITNPLNNTTYEKPIVQYGTTAVEKINSTTGWQAGAVITLTYDGTSWVRDQGYNTNTTYSTITQNEAWTGTATTARSISAANLKSILSNLNGSGLTLTYNATNGIILNHTNSITAKTNYASTATTVSANGGSIILTDIKYDAQGHITASTDRTITLSLPSTMTPSAHTHGNISNTGSIGQTENWSIDNGDELVVADKSNSWKLERSGIAFDGTTTTQALTKAGTWATFNNYSHPTGNGNKHIPKDGASGNFLKYSSAGTAAWANVTWSDIQNIPSTFAPAAHDHDYVKSIENLTGNLTLSQLGLTKVLRFIGSASSTISETTTTAPTIVGRENYTPEIGDVVLDSNDDAEYVCIDKTTTNNTTSYTWELLGRSGDWALDDHTHGNITNNGLLSQANRMVCTDENKAITITNHYTDSTTLAINTTTGQTENLYVNGKVKFNIGTSDGTSQKNFIVYGNSRCLSIGAQGIQAYTTGTTVSPFYLQYHGGAIYIGDQTNRTTINGLIDFATSGGFSYTGMSEASISYDQDRPLWMMVIDSNSNIVKRPTYHTSFGYNTQLRQLKITHAATNSSITTQPSSGFRVYYAGTNAASGNTTSIDMAFMIGSGDQNHGIYDYNKAAWVLSATTTDTNRVWKLNGTATKWTSAQKVYVTLGTASTITTIQGGSTDAQTIGVNGILNIANGGTGTNSINAFGVVYGNSAANAYTSVAPSAEGQVFIGHYSNSAAQAPTWYSGLLLTGTSSSNYSAAFGKDVSIAGSLSFGGTDDFGDAYTPIYWTNGVPTAVTPVQYVTFSIGSGKIGVDLAHTAFTADSYVLQIVVDTGEQYLSSPITWTSASGKIELRCSQVTGTVSGYILVSRGGALSSVTSTQVSST